MVGVVNESVEHGIVEDLPPAAHVFIFGADALVSGVNPVVGDLGRGRAVIRPDLEAVVDIFPRPRASADGNDRNQACRQSGDGSAPETLRQEYKESDRRSRQWVELAWTLDRFKIGPQQRRFRCRVTPLNPAQPAESLKGARWVRTLQTYSSASSLRPVDRKNRRCRNCRAGKSALFRSCRVRGMYRKFRFANRRSRPVRCDVGRLTWHSAGRRRDRPTPAE